MKKLTLVIPTTLFTLSAFAAGFDVTTTETQTITAGNYDYIKYDVSGTLEQTGQVNIKKDGIIVGGSADAKVDAVYHGYTGSAKHILIGSGYTEEGAGVIKGNGKDVSSFTFIGYHLSGDVPTHHTRTGRLNISDITLNFSGSYNASGVSANAGLLRAGVFNIENSVININEGKLAIHRSNTDLGLTNDTDSVTLKNSTLTFNKSGSLIQFDFTSDAENTSNRNISLDNSSFVVASGASNVKFNGANFNLKNGSVLDIAGSGVNFGGANGAGTGIVTLESGSRFSMTGAGSASLIKVEASDSNVHVGSGAILNARFDNIKNAKFTGDGSIAWVNRDTPTTLLDGNVYFNTSTMDFCHFQSKGGTFNTLYVGVDENGNKKQVTLTASGKSGNGFQMNDGSFVIDGNSTVSASSVFNWAETNVAKKSYLGAGSTVNVGTHSRINVADIAGTINVEGGAQTAYGWNYALAFGVLYTTEKNAQQGNVNILDTAEINVNLDDVSTSENANFTILGNITSNAGEGKIKSGQYSKFLIRSNIWKSEHQTVLTLNSKDAFAVGGAASQAESTFYLDSSANVKLVINEENNIGTIDFADAFIKEGSDIIFADTKLALELNNTLTVGQFTGVINLILEDDLKEGVLRITDMDEILANYDTASSFYIKDEAGNDRVLNENLFIKDLGDGSYTIYTEVVVPKPAEWALIFGAIAFGFIAYRRRK